MLLSLSIRDFVIVDKLDLEFSSGFTVLTGETGAGKSILIDALSLALGARGEAGFIRTGCERAEINVTVDIRENTGLKIWLTDNELPNEESELILRRIIYTDGRSRAFINGLPATIQQLKEVGDFLVDIYSQHAHHSLLKSQYQSQVLDEYASLTDLSKEVAIRFKNWFELDQLRLDVEKNAAAHADELAELRDQVRELISIVISPEDWELLQQEHSRLSHGASLLAGSEEARDLLSESEYAAIRQLTNAQHKLQAIVDYDLALQEALDAIDSAVIQLEEGTRFLNRYVQKTELDPARLYEVESQIQTLHNTARKYRVRPEELANLLNNSQARMVELESYANDGELAKQATAAKLAYMELAQQLSSQRKSAATRLSQTITQEMQRLALAGGSFAIDLNEQLPSATGLEQVEFLVAGHAGVTPRPLAKVASGGELSRISLAIRVTTAQQGEIPTMIFDEVDVGIGGGVAETVGQLLGQLGAKRQVLVITHLPQVAAQGQYHMRVSKSVENQQTLSRIEPLTEAQRVEEVARMLGGVEITDTTRKHASEMLGYSTA